MIDLQHLDVKKRIFFTEISKERQNIFTMAATVPVKINCSDGNICGAVFRDYIVGGLGII
jgi:hypothetical protein